MGFKEWYADKFGGGDSAPASNDLDVGANSEVTIGKSYNRDGRVSVSSGDDSTDYSNFSPSSYNTDFSVNTGIHSDIDTSSPYDYNPDARLLSYDDAYERASQNYNNAKSAYDDYVARNSGNVTDELSNYYYQQGLAPLQQNLTKAENSKNMFNPLYTPSYKTSDELNGSDSFQLNAPVMSGNDPTMPSGGVYGTPRLYNPNQPAYQSTDDDGVLRKAGASKYLANPDITEEDLKASLMKPVNWLTDTVSKGVHGFIDGLTPTHVDVDLDTKRDYANRLIDYIEQGYGTEDIKKAAANDAKFLDWLSFIKPFEASGNSKAAMTKTFDDVVAYDMKTGANALGYKSIDDAREGYKLNKDKNKDYDKVESVERMKTEDPAMYEKYSKMNPAQQAIYRAFSSVKGGLASLGNAMLNYTAKAGSEVSKAAENVMFSLDTTPAQSAVYIIANGGLPKNGILKNGQVSEFTQEQWDNMAPSDKARLAKFYGIDSLSEFNKTIKELNYRIGVSSTFNEYYEGKRNEVVEATKPIRDYANVKAYEASYGLNGVAKLGIELIPSAIGMAFDAVVGGLPAMGMRVFGDAYSRAIDKGVDDQRATLYALASTAVEVGTELIGGESVVNAAVYKNKGIFNEGVDAIIANIDSTTMQRIALAAIGGLEEGLEEDMSQLCEPLVEALLETDFFKAVKEGYGEQRAADYAWAALGGALMSIAGAPVADVMTSISNRAAANRIDEETGQPKFVAPNIDGTSRADNPNGRAAYSQSDLKIAQINQRKAIAGNPLAMAAYEQAVNSGASEDEARNTATYVHDSTSTLTPEQKKTYANDQDKFNADIDAFQEHADEFKNAEVGDVVLDADNNEVGVVTKADDNGITVELTNADGEKTTEEVKFVGNNGVLDADSDLAKALGKYNEGAIVNAEEAKIFAQEAAARREAQEAAKAAAANTPKATTDSGTGTVAKPQQPQQPTKKAPTPGKPASMESTDSGTGTAKAAQPKTVYTSEDGKYSIVNNGDGYSVLDSDGNTVGTAKAYSDAVEIIRKGNASGSQPTSQKAPTPGKPASNESTDSGTGTVVAQQTTNPLVQEERSTSGEERAEQQEPVASKNPLVPEIAPESPVSASPETGKSVPTQAQESTDTANETLNDSSETDSSLDEDMYRRYPGLKTRVEKVNKQNAEYENDIRDAREEQQRIRDRAKAEGRELTKGEQSDFDFDERKAKKAQEQIDKNNAELEETLNSYRDTTKTDQICDELRAVLVNDPYADISEYEKQLRAIDPKYADVYIRDTREKAEGIAYLNYLKTHPNATAAEFREAENRPNVERNKGNNNAESVEEDNAPFDIDKIGQIPEKPSNPLVPETKAEETTEQAEETAKPVNPLVPETATETKAEETTSETEEYSEEEMSDFDEWDDDEEYNYRGDISEEEANYTRSKATESFNNKLSDAFEKNGYLTVNDVTDASYAANANFDTHAKSLTNFKTTEDVLNALQNAASKATNPDLAKALSELHQTISDDKRIYEDICSGRIDLANISNQDISKALQYVDAVADQIANENPDNPAFANAQAHDSDPGFWYRDGRYLPSMIKADIFRRVNLAKQEKSSAKTDNKLDGTKPVAEDDHGNKLGKNVANFFRNSKLRDALGRLRVFFHATGNLAHKSYNFKYADDGITMWLASDANTTSSYIATTAQASYFDEETQIGTAQDSALKENAEEELVKIIDGLENVKKLGGNKANQAIDKTLNELRSILDIVRSGNEPHKNDVFYASRHLDSFTNNVYDSEYFDKGDYSQEDKAAAEALSQFQEAIHELEEEVEVPIMGNKANVPLYVNVENPLIIDGGGAAWNEIPIDSEPEVMQILGYIGRGIDKDYYGNHTARTRDIALAAYALGYDGALMQNIVDYGGAGTDMAQEGFIDDERPADILAVFNSNQVKDVKNENPTKSDDFRLKKNLGEDYDSDRFDSLIEQYDGTHHKQAVISKLQAFARKAGMNTDTYGLYDRMLDAVLGITETSGSNYSVEGLQYDTVSDVAYAKSNDKGNSRNMSRDAYENQDRDDYADERQTEPQGKFSDEDAAEIIQLLGEYAELTSNEEENATQEEIEEDASKYKDTGRGFDFTPDESDSNEAYDWKKVSQYMAEEDRSTVAERKSVLEEVFPDKEFRISDDGNGVEEVYTHKTSKNPLTPTEQSWWDKNGWKEIISKFTPKVYSTQNLLPVLRRNGEYNKNVTDATAEGLAGNRLYAQSLLYNGLRYYYQVGQGMYRHILDSNIMSGIKEVVKRHQDAADTLKNRIKNGELYLTITSNPEKTLAAINNLKEQLTKEEAWLEKARSGKYTLKDFYNDKSGIVTQDDIKTVLDSFKGEDKSFDDFSFKALQNAMSETFAKELIDSIYKEEAKNGLDSRGSTGSNAEIQTAESGINIRSGELEERSTGSTPTGYAGSSESGREPSSVTGLSAYDTANQKTSGTEADKSRSAGTGRVMDDSGAVRQVYGTFGPEEQGRRPVSAADITYQAESAHEEFNNAPVESLVIKPRNSTKAGATVQAKKIDDRIYLDGESIGEINPESYRDPNNKDSERLVRIAQTIKDAAAEAGVAVIQLRGQLYSTNTDENGQYYTNTTSALTDLANGYIAISELTADNVGKVMLDVLHEVTHENTFAKFGSNSQALMSFVDRLSKESGVDIKAKATKVIKEYSADGKTFDGDCADEIISRIAEGHDCNGNFTQAEVEALQNALFNSDEFIDMIRKAPSTKALVAYSRTMLRNKPTTPDVGRNKVATSVGYTPSTASTQNQGSTTYYPSGERETPETARQRTARLVGEAIQANMLGDFDRAQELLRMAGTNPTQAREYGMSGELYDMYAEPNGTTRVGNVGLKPDATDAQKRAANLKLKEDLDAWTDETFDSLIAEENARAAAALGEGTPIDQSDMDTLVNEASADEEALLNSRGGNVSAEDTGRFNNLVDQASASEEETLNDLRNDSEDITNASEGSFDNLVDTENQSIEDALNAGAESSANQYPERRFKDAKDYYGKAYDEVVSKVATKHARANSRSSFTHEDIYNKLYGNTPDAKQNFRRLQKLNTNIDSLLKGKMSAQAFNGFIKNMMGEQGIGQIVNDDIQREFSELAKLEEKATGGDQHDSDVINFQYAAADAVAHLCARMDMVEKTERARAKLDTLAKEHGKTNKKALGNALDWYNRMQITGDNFWRMAGNWDAASRNQGYALAQEHNKAIATRISEEAKLKDYFSGINKNSKQFRDFANGTTMSNVDFEGHKISLMEAVKFVKICDTMRAFANENRRPDWQRVAALGGFAFEGKDGKPVFVDIQGSKKNGGSERVKWVQEHYDAAMAEIQANKAASEYMKACEEMYWDASQTAEKVHSKVNGYERYMYGKGKYTDIHYASKDGAVDFSYKDRDAIDVHDTGIMQKRTRVNGGYVICNPMSRSIDAYISQISNYIAFEEFGQKLGVLNDSKSINGNYANTVGDAYGSQYSQWFDNYVKSMTLYRQTDPKKFTDKALQKARQAMMTGALLGSVSVPLKQVSSFFDITGYVDPRAVFKAFASNPSGKKVKGIQNNLLLAREQSISDPDYAEFFDSSKFMTWFKNTRPGKLLYGATNIMDVKAVSNVYRACVYDVEMNTMPADKLYKNGKNFKDGLTAEGQFYVDSKFEQVLLGTQPIFTPQARNELARTDNQFARMFQTFRTQQTQNYNRMLQAWNENEAAMRNGGDTKETSKKLRQTLTGQLTASASLAALTAIANAVLHKHKKYKDDDDEIDKEKLLTRIGIDTFTSMMGNALWVGDIAKYMIDMYNKHTHPDSDWKYMNKEAQYFDVNDKVHIPIPTSGAIGTALQVINSSINLYENVSQNGWTDANVVSARYLAGNAATAFGINANNMYSAINAGYQWWNFAMHLATGDSKYEHKYDDIFTQWAKVDNSQQNRLINAIHAGNDKKIEDLIDDIGEDKLANTVRYGGLDQYKNGKIDKAEYVDMLMTYAGMDYKSALSEVDKKIKLIDSGISQYNGIDGRDGRAAFYDQYSDNFKNKQVYKDFFADVKAGKADGKHKTYYTTYNGKQSEVTANQSSIIDRMNENIKAGNFDYNTAKLLWENYYGYSSSKWSAWQYVGK